MRGREHDGWQRVARCGNGEAVHPRHAHVEKHQIGSEGSYRFQFRDTIGGFADDLYVREAFEHACQAAECRRLVVNEQNSHESATVVAWGRGLGGNHDGCPVASQRPAAELEGGGLAVGQGQPLAHVA